MKLECTGVILAGGKNSRLPGKKKTFRKVGGHMILENIYRVSSSLFQEVIIVVNEPGDFAGWDMTVVTDIIPTRCALAGIHAGPFYSSFHNIYVTACDTPFVNPCVIEYIVGQARPEFEVVIPWTDDGLEPLSAVYSKDCIPLIEANLAKDIYMIKKFFRKKKVKQISAERIRALDPDMQFVFNVNTPADLELAQAIAAGKPGENQRGK